MSTHLKRVVAFGVGGDEGREALQRVLARRGAMPTLRTAANASGGDGARAWTLDIDASDAAAGDPSLARELSSELGGFVVSAEASRHLGYCGYAVFFAGRPLEVFRRDADGHRLADPEPNPSAISGPEDVYPALAELYSRLTGFPMSDEPRASRDRLADVGPPQVNPAAHASPRTSERLSFALFPLVGTRDFEGRPGALDTEPPSGWRWRSSQTLAGIPYVVLIREGDLDPALFGDLVQRLDVPTAAVALDADGGGFRWWTKQPGQPASEGYGRGALSFIDHLTAATSALGEEPGLIRV